MKAYSFQQNDIIESANIVGVKVDYEKLADSRRGNGTYHIKLYPDIDNDPNNFRRYGQSGLRGYRPVTRINAVCWHGFKHFFDEMFDRRPGGKIVTALATYDTIDGYHENYLATQYHNIGSAIDPVYLVDACTCNFLTDAAERDAA